LDEIRFLHTLELLANSSYEARKKAKAKQKKKKLDVYRLPKGGGMGFHKTE
jgi:hypothetical protein